MSSKSKRAKAKRGSAKKPRSRGGKRTVITRPLLSMAMMVKDEELFLEEALRSAQGWCDELVVVDTGSTDRTVEIAKDLGAKVSFFEWPNDFSKARNVTLRRATGRYIAVLDADERFRSPNPEAIRRFLKPGPLHPFEALMVNVINVQLDMTPVSSFFSTRFFPNDPRLGYGGRVHNRFGALVEDAPTILCTRYIGTEVIHLGYDPEIYASRKKAERSLPLIELTVAEEPENWQYRYYLGRELLLLDRVDEAIVQLRIALAGLEPRGAASGTLMDTVNTLLMAYERSAELPEAIALSERMLQVFPEHPDIWYDLGRTLAQSGRKREAAQAVARALACPKVRASGQVRLDHKRWEAEELHGNLLFELGAYGDAYAAFHRALPDKPAQSMGWARMLNSMCGLAIELRDEARCEGLLDRLIDTPEAPLGMLFFEISRRIRALGPDAGRAFLLRARQRNPRVALDAEYGPIARQLGVE